MIVVVEFADFIGKLDHNAHVMMYNTDTFPIRGVVEGFYGPPYTFPQRDDLLRWMGERGYNLYLYGPKNDRQHRNLWREPYPAKVMDRFAATIRAAESVGVTFCYALSPCVSLRYSSAEDFALITRKFAAFYDLGVRAFSIFCDDITAALRHPADVSAFPSVAVAHADLCNQVFTWLQRRDPACTLSMCPTDYFGSPPFSTYLWELGAHLHPAIDVFYTGPETCSPTIAAADATAFAAALRRRPIIWDNYPVNDLAMKSALHLGPVTGRAAELAAVTRGVVVNPMLQPEASKVALATYAEFLADPRNYMPEPAWLRALEALVGDESAPALRIFAANTCASALDPNDAAQLRQLVEDVLRALDSSKPPPNYAALHALAAYLDELDAASYHIKNRMENLALRSELLPWIEVCDLWLDAGRRAVRVLLAEDDDAATVLRREIPEYFAAALAHHKRYGAQVLEPFIRYVLGLMVEGRM